MLEPRPYFNPLGKDYDVLGIHVVDALRSSHLFATLARQVGLERGRIIDRLNTEIGKAMNDPEVAARLSAQTLEPAHRPPEEFAQRLRTDYETIGKLFRRFDVKLD